MLDVSFSTNFIHRIRSQTDFNVNIMNERGVIIASCDSERIGSFHALAYDMIKNNISIKQLHSIKEPLNGVTSPGVNMLLRENFIPIGVIGVSGNPEVVMPLAKLIKLSFESLHDHALQQKFFDSVDKSEGIGCFIRLLLYEKPLNVQRIRSEASKLGVVENIERYPLLIEYIGIKERKMIYKQFMADYSSCEIYSPDDFYFDSKKFLVLFKRIKQQSVGNYRNEILRGIEKIDTWFKEHDCNCKIKFICGTVQNSFLNYSLVFENMKWLYYYRQKQEKPVYFLGDYLTEFMMKNLSVEMMAPWLDIYVRLIDENMDRNMFLETVGALIASDMNLLMASKKLFLHKNTLFNRVKKIKEILGLNPLNSVRDSFFIIALYTYMQTF